MRIEVTEYAKNEFRNLIEKLENARAGLGHRLRAEFQIVLDNLERSPQLYALTEDGIRGLETRNAIIERFHVRVVYLVLPDEVKILSIIEGRRRPGSWHSSLADE